MKRFLVLLKFAACSSLAFAQWSTDPAQNLQVLRNCIKPRIATDGDGGVIIVGESFTQNPVLQAQRVDKYGAILWDPSLRGIRVATMSDEQAEAIVLSDGEGGAYLSFQAKTIVGYDPVLRETIYSSPVRVQRIDAQGNLLFGPEGVMIHENPDNVVTGQDNYALVLGDSGGIYTLVGAPRGLQGRNAYVNYVAPNGQLPWESSLALHPATDWIKKNFLAYPDGEGGLIIYYTPFNSSYSDRFIRINKRREIIIDKPIETGLTPFYLFAAEQGEGILFWQDFNQLMQLDIIRCQKIERNGEKIWGENPVIIDSTGLIANVRLVGIASDHAGGAFVAYGIKKLKSLIVHMNNQGRITLKEIVSNFNAEAFSEQECMILINHRGILYSTFVWQEFGHAYALDSLGNEIWPKVTYSTRQQDNSFDAMISDSNGGAIFAWHEILPSRGIWTQQVNSSGQLGIVTGVKNPSDQKSLPQNFELLPAYPNPFRAAVRIAYQLNKPQEVFLKVYDLAGKEVIALVKQRQAPGLHEVIWNGRDKHGRLASSGVYFYQLSTESQQQMRKLVFLR